MHKEMSDQELKEAMKTIASVASIKLAEDRIDKALPAFKSFLADVDAIRSVDLPLENEPITVFRLKKRSQKKGGE